MQRLSQDPAQSNLLNMWTKYLGDFCRLYDFGLERGKQLSSNRPNWVGNFSLAVSAGIRRFGWRCQGIRHRTEDGQVRFLMIEQLHLTTSHSGAAQGAKG